MSRTVAVRRAQPTDRRFIETVLRTNDLVVADRSTVEDTFVCETDGERIGIGGLEQYRDVALLRSVAIHESVRDRGYGTELCTQLLEKAGANGITEIYLFTTTAPEFFAALGFERTDRESVPESIRATTECRDRCRSTAVCMKRRLNAGAAGEEPGEN